MKSLRRIAIFLSLLACICSAQVRPPFPGHLKLPPGFYIRTWFGIDSSCGEIKNDLGFVIHYDIGEMAGVATAGGLIGERARTRTDQHLKGEISRRVVPLPNQFAVVVV